MDNMPVEEGWVYGQAAKQPHAIPDIESMFEAAEIPKGKLGDLPHPREWYDGAKDRAKARAVEMEELYFRKDELRTAWVDLVLNELEGWGAKVDERLSTAGPILGLAELLARTAHERPSEEERVEYLMSRMAEVTTIQQGLREDLTRVREHISSNEEAIRRKEVEDASAERERIALKKATDIKKAKAERALARQAALLRGEELPPSEDGDGEEANLDEVAEGSSGAPSPQGATAAAPPPPPASPPPVPPGSVPASSFLTPAVALPVTSLELRGGLARQLPPLGSAGSPPQPPPVSRGAR